MKIVALYDTHIGFDYKGNQNHINLKPIFRFIADFKPDRIVLGGDMHDWTPASHWIANQSLQLEGQSIKRCFDELNTYLLKPLSMYARHCQIIYLLGNHEDWLQQTLMLNRNGLGYWQMEDNIDLKKYNMKIVPVNKAWSVSNHLCYIHGIYTTLYHAKKTVETYHRSVIYGHVHTFQSHILTSPVDSKLFYKGQSVGCLCNLNPNYMHNKPNAWVHGFHINYINDKTGYFHDVPIVIVNNTFWANGKFYE